MATPIPIPVPVPSDEERIMETPTPVPSDEELKRQLDIALRKQVELYAEYEEIQLLQKDLMDELVLLEEVQKREDEINLHQKKMQAYWAQEKQKNLKQNQNPEQPDKEKTGGAAHNPAACLKCKRFNTAVSYLTEGVMRALLRQGMEHLELDRIKLRIMPMRKEVIKVQFDEGLSMLRRTEQYHKHAVVYGKTFSQMVKMKHCVAIQKKIRDSLRLVDIMKRSNSCLQNSVVSVRTNLMHHILNEISHGRWFT